MRIPRALGPSCFAVLLACTDGEIGDGGGAGGSRDTGGGGGADTPAGGGAGAGGGATGGAGGQMVVPIVPAYDWTFFIGTGQSLSVGAVSVAVSTDPDPVNLRLVDLGPDPKYPIDDTGAPDFELVPLAEPLRAWSAGAGPGYDDGQYPNNIAGETPQTAMAGQLTYQWENAPDREGQLVSVQTAVGWSGHPLSDIDKAGTGRAYPASIHEAQVITQRAANAGKTFGVGAVVLTHGESDAGNPNYGAGLLQLQSDYDADLRLMTGQTAPVLMLVSQQSSIVGGPMGSAPQVYRVAEEHSNRIVCVGPKYAYEYADDHVHFKAGGYLRLGQKYAEVYDAIAYRGVDWHPVGPTSVDREDARLVIHFHVPTPPLVWETNVASPHATAHLAWQNGHGFEVVSSTGQEIEIEDATIEGDTIILDFAAPLPAGALSLQYAITQDGAGAQGGTPLGLRGDLRDSNRAPTFDDVTTTVNVTQGSTAVTAVTPGAFARRTGYDRVAGDGLTEGAMVVSVASADALTLSEPWTGPSGQIELSFERDMFNYAVHFAMSVP